MNDGNNEGKLHIGHRKRIKERYLRRGFESLDDTDLLELMLTYAIPRRDVYELAHRLVDRFGSLENVIRALPGELSSEGLSEHTVILLKLINDLRTKQLNTVKYRHERLTSVLKTAEYCHGILRDLPEEAVILLFLDSDNCVIDAVKISCGSEDSAVLPIGMIVDSACRQGVGRVIISHNHPSGSSIPSTADVSSTDTLIRTLRSHGIELVEHIVVAKSECTALLRHQTIPMPNDAAFMPWKEERPLE